MAYFTEIQFEQEDSFYPVDGVVTGLDGAKLDVSGNLKSRSAVLTDESSYRDDFLTLEPEWAQTINGNGTIGVANSLLTIGSGTATGLTSVIYTGDYGPVTVRGKLAISQRVANQEIIFGFTFRSAGIDYGAYFLFDGTDNTKVKCVTQSSSDANEIQSTEHTIIGGTTSDLNFFKIDLSNNTVSFSISTFGNNYNLVTQHQTHIPGPYDVVNIELSTLNNAIVTNTNVNCDMIFFNNMNRIQTDDDFTYEPSPVLMHGQTDLGNVLPISVTPEGHIEAALHAPLLPFGSVHTENLTPVFQSDAVYNLDANSAATNVSGTGSVSVSDSLFVAATGATVNSQAVLQSRKRLRYRAGQGIVGRFTAIYTAGVASSYQLAGLGHSEDGVYIGYVGTQFGILYVQRGVREQRTLTVTVGASSSANCTITLNGTAFTVPLTNASNIQRTVYEIATYNGYTGWKAYAASSTTVVFVANSAGAAGGAFSFAAGATGAAATIALTKVGVTSTDTFIPQTSFNVDKLDGTGGSGFTIDPQKGNVFQIDVQYLGFGAITFKVEVAPENVNNATWIIFHVIKLPNTLTTSNFGNPSFPFTLAAYSAGSTTNLEVKCASYMGGIEGQKMLHGNRFSYFNQLTTVGAVNYQCLMTIGNKLTYSGRSNQAVINLISVSGAIKHTSPVIYYLVKNATLAGNPSFADYASNSCSTLDTSATTCTFNNSQVIWSGHLGDTGEIDHHFGNGSFNIEEVTLQPGEYVTLCARSTTGSPAYVTGSINTREDQ